MIYKIYKIRTMGGQEIPLESKEEIENLLSQVEMGKKLILTKYGIVNVSSIDSVVIDKEKSDGVTELRGIGRSEEEARKEILGPSPFAEIKNGLVKKLKGED